MAREIQPQSNRTQGGKAVIAQLGNAVFWVIVGIAVPVEEFLRPIPEVAPYAHLAPILFYVLAAWSFLRAIRTLQRLAASRMWTPRIRVAGGSASSPAQPSGDKRQERAVRRGGASANRPAHALRPPSCLTTDRRF
jgi:hypothetical protein